MLVKLWGNKKLMFWGQSDSTLGMIFALYVADLDSICSPSITRCDPKTKEKIIFHVQINTTAISEKKMVKCVTGTNSIKEWDSSR